MINPKPPFKDTFNPFLYFLKALPAKEDEEIAKSSSKDIPETSKVSATQVSDPQVPEVVSSESLVYNILLSLSQ